MRKKPLIILFSVIAFLVVIVSFLFLCSPVPDRSIFAVTLEELRAAGSLVSGALPDHINVLSVADTVFPPGFAVAGKLKPQKAPFYAYQIVYAGNERAPVIVDTGITKDHISGFSRNVTLNENAFAAIQNAMRRASIIVLTHEHFDHTGGLARSPYFDEIAPKALLTSEQKESPRLQTDLFAPGTIQKTGTLSYDRIHALGAGIVLIKTPGHTPGHQAVYVHLANGKEIILSGDIGWSMDNSRIPWGRPRIASIVLGEDRAESASQLQWLHYIELSGVTVLVTHDLEWTQELVGKGIVREGFE